MDNKASTSIPSRVLAAVSPLKVPDSKVLGLISAITSGQSAALGRYPSNVVAAAQKGIQWGYSDGFRLAWLAAIPFGVIACVLAYFVTDVSPYFTSHIAVTLEKERLGGKTIGSKGEDEASQP